MNARPPLLPVVAVLVLGAGSAALAQPASSPALAAPGAPAPALVAPPPAGAATGAVGVPRLTEVAPPEEARTFRYGNRPIVRLRARLLGRTPAERAEVMARRLDELYAQGLRGPVEWRSVGGVGVLSVAGREAVTILPTDVDELAGETLETTSRAATRALERALEEVSEARSPRLLLQGALRALAATLVALLLGGVLWWLRHRVTRRVTAWLDTGLARSLERHTQVGDIWRTTEAGLVAAMRGLGRLVVVTLAALLAYAWLTFTLRQFPYTRPWGEALRGFVIETVKHLGEGLLRALPGLFTVVLIVVITRLLVRLANAAFRAVEQGRLSLPGVYAETAQPTRRLAVALLWLFAVVVAYPYLPGSESDAFKGVSVFVGLMLSLGSSGLVNQAMSSFMITYSRALRLGDFVKIGEVEGTVVHSGLLATKILTRRNEEITLPNAVVAASTITNYSRHSGEGVFTGTSVTIGYDTPWRQVEAMLLLAASRTPGLRADPPPLVLQTGLQDFYVQYTLVAAIEKPAERLAVLSRLHGEIQDAFNEHGVQIMSPNYEADPAVPKVVPKSQWFATPAKPEERG